MWRRSPNADSAPIAGGDAKTGGVANKDGKAKRPDIRIVIPSKEAEFAADPKWLVEPDLKKLLPGGRWKSELGEGREFLADGSLTTFAGGVTGGMTKMKGTYRITGADTVETTMQTPLAGLQKETFRLLVNDELALLKDEFGGSKLKPGEYWLVGTYYRMRPDGTGLGRTKLIDPHIEKLKSKDAKIQGFALFMLAHYGEDAWPAVPAVISHSETKASGAQGNIADEGYRSESKGRGAGVAKPSDVHRPADDRVHDVGAGRNRPRRTGRHSRPPKNQGPPFEEMAVRALKKIEGK